MSDNFGDNPIFYLAIMIVAFLRWLMEKKKRSRDDDEVGGELSEYFPQSDKDVEVAAEGRPKAAPSTIKVDRPYKKIGKNIKLDQPPKSIQMLEKLAEIKASPPRKDRVKPVLRKKSSVLKQLELTDRESLKKAIILREIIGRPISLR